MQKHASTDQLTSPRAQMTVREVQSLSKLRPKQQKFLLAYATSGNATQAALQAGYSPTTARQQGSRILANKLTQEAMLAYGMLGLYVIADLAEHSKSGMIRYRAAAKLLDVCIPKNILEQPLEPKRMIIEHRDYVAEQKVKQTQVA
jgi:hypothetical protein